MAAFHIREYFDVKIFLDSMACVKIKSTKCMRNINDNAVSYGSVYYIPNRTELHDFHPLLRSSYLTLWSLTT